MALALKKDGDPRKQDVSPVPPAEENALTCLLCPRLLGPRDRVVWVPGIDAPAHQACLDRELGLRPPPARAVKKRPRPGPPVDRSEPGRC